MGVMEQNRSACYFFDAAHLNTNCNASKPGNVNPEFGANEPGCGCTFSYNGGAGGGTAAPCCDNARPYEEGFNDKKRDTACCCESSRCYQRPVANSKADNSGSSYKYVPEYNSPPAACPVEGLAQQQSSEGCGCGETYQGGLTNKKPEGISEEQSCCNNQGCQGPDTYESIANTDAQRYKGKGPDRRNFYANDDCCSSPQSNNSSSNNNLFDGETDWCEIRRLAYGAISDCSACSPKMIRRSPSFYCEEDNYVKGISSSTIRRN